MKATIVKFENENFKPVFVLVKNTIDTRKAVKAVKDYQMYLRCVILDSFTFRNAEINEDANLIKEAGKEYNFSFSL